MNRERKVVLYIAQSLDGYIARVNGDIDWLEGDNSEPESDFGYGEFYDSIDTILICKNTYEQIKNELSPEMWPYEGKKSYVVSDEKIEGNGEIEAIGNDVVSFLNRIKKDEGKDIWIVGDAALIESLVKANMIDEYVIAIMPTILGDGLKLFKEGDPEIKLRFNGSEVHNGAVVIHYEKDKVIVG